MQFINPGHDFAAERNNDIAFAQTGADRRTVGWGLAFAAPSLAAIEPAILNAATNSAVLLAMAKQIPCAGRMIAVFTPMTSPRELTSGPPELPGFNAASVWMTLSINRPDCERIE